MRRRNESLLENQERLRAKVRRLPNHQIGHLPYLNAANHVADPLGQRRIDRIFADIALDSVVIRSKVVILGQSSPLHHVLMRRVPGASYDFATSSHSLRVGGHHTNGTRVMQNVFGGNGLRPDPAVSKRDILRDILREMVARHDHVKMLVDGVSSIRLRWVGAARKNIRMLDERYHVWSVTSSGTFNVIGMDCPALERRGCPFNKSGFVQGIAMDLALNIVVVADTASLAYTLYFI